MKKLPKIYKTNIDKNIRNNKEVTYVKNINNTSNSDINTILNTIFNGIGHSYNIPLLIKTINKSYHTSLISRNKNSIATLDNDIILLKDIISIEILK